MERNIVGFVVDDTGHWAAELDCFHRQHVRHNPPFRLAPWVIDARGRAQHVGTALECPLCDRAELPGGLQVRRITDIWDEQTMPAGLRRAHLVAAGNWGQLRVQSGSLQFRARTDPPIDVVLHAEAVQAIPPGVRHEVLPCGPVRFFLEFLAPPADAVEQEAHRSPDPG